MADYAGAVAALRAAFEASAITAPRIYQNEDPPQKPWPPAVPVPWIYLEVIQSSSELRGAGLPGNQTWLTLGHVLIHVFAPKGYALPAHLALAGQAGELYRSKTFYNTDPGAKLTCYAPAIQGGDSASDDGNYFGVTVSIPFEFFFLA